MLFPRHAQWYILSNIEQMGFVIDAIVDAMTRAGLSSKDVFGGRLALEEAISNSLRHGHQFDPNKVVRVSYGMEHDDFLIEVQDDGPGYDPSSVTDPTVPANRDQPGGRGLLLIRHYAAWVRVNESGNCLTFAIRRTNSECRTQSPAQFAVAESE